MPDSYKLGTLYAPISDYDAKVHNLGIDVFFDIIHVAEHENGGLYLEYQMPDSNASQWDNFSVSVSPNGKFKGRGSVRHRERINDVISWYKKAKTDPDYYDLLRFWDV